MACYSVAQSSFTTVKGVGLCLPFCVNKLEAHLNFLYYVPPACIIQSKEDIPFWFMI